MAFNVKRPVRESTALLPDRYLPALTGVRAVGAYLVFLHHYNPASPGTFAWRLFNQGYMGVTIFFVLSGFLIYHRYADAWLLGNNWSWRRYLQSRFARIYPLYALLLLATVSVEALLGLPMNGLAFGLNVTLLNGFLDNYKFSGIAQSWSLTVELSFYLLAPLLFTGIKRWGALWLTAGLISTGLILWQLSIFDTLSFVWFYTFFGRAFEFVAGMWLARQWHKGRLLPLRFAGLTGLFIGIGGVVWQAVFTGYTLPENCQMWSEVLAYNVILPIGISLIFWGLITEKSFIGKLLSQPFMQALGRGSYAFYLIHIGVVASGLQKAGVDNRWLLFCCFVVIAQGLYQFVEKPLQRWLRS